MLAYIFWHRPYPNTECQRYEEGIVRFQNDLEDWYLLDGTWAMDPLNAFAISGHVEAPHDSVAR